MKLNGERIDKPHEDFIVIPRGDGEGLVIRAKAVLNYDKFNVLCPTPKPPKTKVIRGGKVVEDFEDEFYVQECNDYGKKKTSWMILESLRATEGLEWENLDYSDPTTWNNWEGELNASGFSDTERQRILNLVITVNCLNEAKLEEARNRFLATTLVGVSDQSTSRQQGQTSTPSTEPVNGSASALPT